MASGAKGSPCAGVQSAQNAPGMARGGGGGGGGRSGAASGGGPYDRIFWLFLPGVSLNGLFLSGVSLNGMASVFIGRPPARRRRLLFLAVGFPGQAAHTRPANERPPLRDAWPRRARRGECEGEGEGVPSSASGCAGVAAPRGGGEALEDGGGGQGGGHGDPPSRRSREEGGESPLSRGMGRARQQQQQQQQKSRQ